MSRKKRTEVRGSSTRGSDAATRNPQPAARAGHVAAPRQRRWGWSLAIAAIALFGALSIGLVLWGMRQPSTRRGQPFGISCASFPPFAQRLGFTARAAMDTSDTHQPGLRLVESAGSGQQPHVYQDPSWTQAGFLGTPVLDIAGNIYVAPAPQTSLILNPPEQQTRVYKIDGQTGQMSLFATVPAAQAPPPENPFGILGLAVDCQTNSLYAASVAGSTRQEEVGRIARIDLRTGQVTSQVDGIDGFGLVAGREKDVPGGRLYVGRARTPEIWSIALDKDGNLIGRPELELAFGPFLSDGDGRVRRLILAPNGMLSLIITPFVYTLAPPTTSPQRLAFTYDLAKKSWRPVPEQGAP